MSARSYLYVPADRADRLAKAPERGADALICDLEDGVAPQDKDVARKNLSAFLADAPAEVWVRVNSGGLMASDVRAIGIAPVRGTVLPKADLAAVASLDALLVSLAVDAAIAPLVETASGVLELVELARAPRVLRMSIGEVDLASDLAMTPSDDGRELLPIRTLVVVASAAAGIDQPTAPISTDYRDLDAFRASTEGFARAGYGSRAAIHPAQVEIINDVFTPTADEVASARRLVDLFEAAGGGACVDDEGRMVDEAVVRSARRVLDRASSQ